MRIIVNEKQYKRLLKNQHNTKKYISEWVNYVEDMLYPYLNEVTEEDTFTIKNLRNKIGKTNFFKELQIENINVNLLKGNKDKVYLGDVYNEGRVVKDLELDVYVSDVNKRADNFLQEFIKLNNKILLNEQNRLVIPDNVWDKLNDGEIYNTLEKEELIDSLHRIDMDIYDFTGKSMVVKDVNKSNNTIIIQNPNFTEEQISLLLNRDGEMTDYWDMRLNGGDVEIKIRPYGGSYGSTEVGDFYDDTILIEPEVEPEVIDDIDNSEDVYNVPNVDYNLPPEGSFALKTLNTCEKNIMYMISSAEAKKHSYDSVFPSKTIPGLSNLTLINAVATVFSQGGNAETAMGRYQFLPKNIYYYWKNALPYNEETKFTPINQDKVIKYWIKENTKDNDCLKLHNALVRSWAGLPILYPMNGKSRGKSYYESSINSANIDANKFQKLLYDCDLCDSTNLKEKIKETLPQEWDGAEVINTVIDNPIDDSETEINFDAVKKKRNFDKIPAGNNLWRSGQLGLDELKYVIEKYGIKNIIRLNKGSNDNKIKGGNDIVTVDQEKELAEKLGVDFNFIDAHQGYQSGKGYVGTTSKVQPILKQGNTLIHCAHGADRTGGQVGRFVKDNTSWDDKKIWKYTTDYNRWCKYVWQKFEGKGGSQQRGGFDAYAQSFIDDLDYFTMKELCDPRKNGFKQYKKEGKIKVLIIGDSHSVPTGYSYSNKLLNSSDYQGDLIARGGAGTKWMLNQLKGIPTNILKTYDVVVIFGGGNDAQNKSPNATISNLKNMYKYIESKGKRGVKIIGITPPNKKLKTKKTGIKYPSNDAIGEFVINQNIKRNGKNNIDLRNVGENALTKDLIHINKAGHGAILKLLKDTIEN